MINTAITQGRRGQEYFFHPGIINQWGIGYLKNGILFPRKCEKSGHCKGLKTDLRIVSCRLIDLFFVAKGAVIFVGVAEVATWYSSAMEVSCVSSLSYPSETGASSFLASQTVFAMTRRSTRTNGMGTF